MEIIVLYFDEEIIVGGMLYHHCSVNIIINVCNFSINIIDTQAIKNNSVALLKVAFHLLLHKNLLNFKALYSKGTLIKGKVSICGIFYMSWNHQSTKELTGIISTIKRCAFMLCFSNYVNFGG